MLRLRILASFAAIACVALIIVNVTHAAPGGLDRRATLDAGSTADVHLAPNQGQQVFRFDTFGDQDFWGGTLQLHKAIEGARFGGVGPGISPRTALALGLKVDVDALPGQLQEDLKHGKVNLDDPAVTLALLKLNAVVGITGYLDPREGLSSVGIQCSLCHSTVDNSLTPGIGHRWMGGRTGISMSARSWLPRQTSSRSLTCWAPMLVLW